MDPFLLLLIGVVIVVGGIVFLRLHAFIALMGAAIVVSALTPRDAIERAVLSQKRPAAEAKARADEHLGAKLANKFGGACTSLGVLIAMASIVGAGLLHSGAADRIVRSTLALFGERRTPIVLAVCGLVLGVPVFFDTVFLLLIPLARAMAVRTGKDYLLYVLAIAVGTTMTHSLVPPTPGPLFAANALKVDLGTMMIGGLLLSAFAATVGLGYAWWANRRWPIAVRSPSAEGTAAPLVERPDHELPPLWLALAPIVLPVLLISGSTVAEVVALPAELKKLIGTLGHPNIAVALAAGIALLMVATRRGAEPKKVKSTVQEALADAGMIILITAAGGVFGGVLQETGVGERIQGLAREYRIGVLPLAFFVTAFIRTAQGSATVAMVTSVGIVGAFATPETLGCHPVYLALTIGCASKLVPWMNDSGFWVVSKTAGLTERETLRTMSVMFSLMGVAGFLAVLVAATLFPLI
ncbi:MAG: SLC13 family permease [Opitutaceae bacterium]|nr:SLC13 family permease [Opitutaceae bacterium]